MKAIQQEFPKIGQNGVLNLMLTLSFWHIQKYKASTLITRKTFTLQFLVKPHFMPACQMQGNCSTRQLLWHLGNIIDPRPMSPKTCMPSRTPIIWKPILKKTMHTTIFNVDIFVSFAHLHVHFYPRLRPVRYLLPKISNWSWSPSQQNMSQHFLYIIILC